MDIYKAREVLGIADGDTLKEVKKKYRALMRKYHPDINPKGLAMSQLINEAYDYVVIHGVGKASQSSTRTKQSQARKTRPEPKPQADLSEKYHKHKLCNSFAEIYELKAWLLSSGRAKDDLDIWVTKDCRVYVIKDISTSHLTNIKKYIQKPNYTDLGSILGDRLSEQYRRVCEELATRTPASSEVLDTPKGKKIILHF